MEQQGRDSGSKLSQDVLLQMHNAWQGTNKAQAAQARGYSSKCSMPALCRRAQLPCNSCTH
jgi:hypothetical protein